MSVRRRCSVCRVAPARPRSTASTGCWSVSSPACRSGRGTSCGWARVRNPAFAEGLSSSLKTGLTALPSDIDSVLVCLGDMPLVAGRDLDRLIAAFNPLEGRAIVVPIRRGKRGNPVLWAKRFFPEMAELAGDVGAKHLIGEHAELVAEIEMDSDGVLVDIDTPDALAGLRDKVKPTAA